MKHRTLKHPKYDQQNAEYCIRHILNFAFQKSHSHMRVTLIFYLFFLASISARASLRERLILPIRSISVTLTIISSPTETISSILFNSLLVKFRNVNETVHTGTNFNKCAEFHKSYNFTSVKCSYLWAVSNSFNYLNSLLVLSASIPLMNTFPSSFISILTSQSAEIF